jgi:hypothetical protein
MDTQTDLVQQSNIGLIQGNGVHVFDNLGEMETLMNKYIAGVAP